QRPHTQDNFRSQPQFGRIDDVLDGFTNNRLQRTESRCTKKAPKVLSDVSRCSVGLGEQLQGLHDHLARVRSSSSSSVTVHSDRDAAARSSWYSTPLIPGGTVAFGSMEGTSRGKSGPTLYSDSLSIRKASLFQTGLATSGQPTLLIRMRTASGSSAFRNTLVPTASIVSMPPALGSRTKCTRCRAPFEGGSSCSSP